MLDKCYTLGSNLPKNDDLHERFFASVATDIHCTTVASLGSLVLFLPTDISLSLSLSRDPKSRSKKPGSSIFTTGRLAHRLGSHANAHVILIKPAPEARAMEKSPFPCFPRPGAVASLGNGGLGLSRAYIRLEMNKYQGFVVSRSSFPEGPLDSLGTSYCGSKEKRPPSSIS